MRNPACASRWSAGTLQFGNSLDFQMRMLGLLPFAVDSFLRGGGDLIVLFSFALF